VGLGGQGNGGVARLVKETPYSIGYVELAYAIKSNLPYGWVKNHAGNFVKANLESVTAAAAGAAQTMPVSITNAPRKGLSNLELHMASCPGKIQRQKQATGHEGLSAMDVDGWPKAD